MTINNISLNAPNLLGQVYLSCRFEGNTHEGSLNVAEEAVKTFGSEQVNRENLDLILESLIVG